MLHREVLMFIYSSPSIIKLESTVGVHTSAISIIVRDGTYSVYTVSHSMALPYSVGSVRSSIGVMGTSPSSYDYIAVLYLRSYRTGDLSKGFAIKDIIAMLELDMVSP